MSSTGRWMREARSDLPVEACYPDRVKQAVSKYLQQSLPDILPNVIPLINDHNKLAKDSNLVEPFNIKLEEFNIDGYSSSEAVSRVADNGLAILRGGRLMDELFALPPERIVTISQELINILGHFLGAGNVAVRNPNLLNWFLNRLSSNSLDERLASGPIGTLISSVAPVISPILQVSMENLQGLPKAHNRVRILEDELKERRKDVGEYPAKAKNALEEYDAGINELDQALQGMRETSIDSTQGFALHVRSGREAFEQQITILKRLTDCSQTTVDSLLAAHAGVEAMKNTTASALTGGNDLVFAARHLISAKAKEYRILRLTRLGMSFSAALSTAILDGCDAIEDEREARRWIGYGRFAESIFGLGERFREALSAGNFVEGEVVES